MLMTKAAGTAQQQSSMDFFHFSLISIGRDLHLPALLCPLTMTFFLLLLNQLSLTSLHKETSRHAQVRQKCSDPEARFHLPFSSPSLDPEMLSACGAALFICQFDRIISAGLRYDWRRSNTTAHVDGRQMRTCLRVRVADNADAHAHTVQCSGSCRCTSWPIKGRWLLAASHNR